MNLKKCNQCVLEGNNGKCDRNDCSNYTQKPSDRIQEIYDGIICPPKNTEIALINRHIAICRYLDEEWGKNQPCQHDIPDEPILLAKGEKLICHKCNKLLASN